MAEGTRQTITTVAWDAIIKQRIQTMCREWNLLPVQERFWLVITWLNEYYVIDPTRTQRQQFMPKDYWQFGCDDQTHQ